MPTSSAQASPSSKGKGRAVEKKTKAPVKKATATKATVAKTSAHPTWKDMIKECIIAHPEDVRSGVSRSTIKKFAETKYKMDMNSLAISQLNRAIAHGAEAGTFLLPKGPSGKVKLAPKVKVDASKENAKPPSAKSNATKKPAAKPVAAKSKTTAPKKPVAKNTSVKKAKATGTKGTKTVKKTSSAKSGTKKAAVKTAAAKPKVAKAKKPASKKTTA